MIVLKYILSIILLANLFLTALGQTFLPTQLGNITTNYQGVETNP